MAEAGGFEFEWLTTGDAAFAAAGAAIVAARKCVRLEVYIYTGGELGRRLLLALLRARERGARVRVLVDALGSMELDDGFWKPLRDAGGEVRWFNPLSLGRFAVRDHRKLLVCDERVAFVGGFNVADEYAGDGVTRGWRDIGLRLTGGPAHELAASFDDLFERAAFHHRAVLALRDFEAKHVVPARNWRLLLSGPGRGANPLLLALRQDLARCRSAQIVVPYFLPAARLRRALSKVARRGGRAQLILPGRSDVPLAKLASQNLYRRLLKAGVEILEYEPQMLHAKLFILDGVVYVGSSNLDPRSLRINYELTLRLDAPALVGGARKYFRQTAAHCRSIEWAAWGAARTWWQRFKQRWAFFLLARIDPAVANWQMRRLPW